MCVLSRMLFLLLLLPTITCNRVFVAHFNMAGVEGDVRFNQQSVDLPVLVRASLLIPWNTDQVNASWSIHTFPVDYNFQPACSQSNLGPRQIDLSSILGRLTLPAEGIEWNTTEISLWGRNTIWDQSVVIEFGGVTSCATLLPTAPVRTMESRFTGPIAGRVLFRQLIAPSPEEALISVNLFPIDSTPSANHKWQILATDVLDSRGKSDKCDHLHVLYDTGVKNSSLCSTNTHDNCPLGDLTSKHGPVHVGGRKFRFVDSNLWLPELSITVRRLFLVIYDSKFPDSVYACAPMVELKPREVISNIDFRHVRGSIHILQKSPMDLSNITLKLEAMLSTTVSAIAIHEFPVGVQLTKHDDVCALTGKPFNPFQISESPDVGNATYDLFVVGDLSGKYGALEGSFVDAYIQLFGENSVLGRSIVVHLNEGSSRSCATLQSARPVIWARAIFVHPLAGQVFFQQLADEPSSETYVHVDGLQYADDHANDTQGHKWGVYSNSVGRDYLNWTKRCESAGNLYNPTSVNLVSKSQLNCGGNAFRCALGDLGRKSGFLRVGARRSSIPLTRRFHVDLHLPLSGANSILGRTLVILDDFAPAFRGNRMSCAIIRSTISIRASVSSWRSSEDNLPIAGGIHLVQPTTFDPSNVLVELNGLKGLGSRYSINEAPVPFELDFPCGEDVLQRRFNPFNITNLHPEIADSRDEFAVGDLSGKYGDLKEKEEIREELIDTNLPLQGPNSVVGRSVVIHKKEKNLRWACANIELDVPEGVEKIHAMVSFQDPKGFAYGVMRLTQLVTKSGGFSDTWIEATLRYPGINNKNLTRDHKWSVYVNPVGYDATVTPFKDRCVAAGFKWNPYLIVDSIDEYSTECSIWTPFRCVMGDVSLRQSTLDIGGKTKVFSDSNLPLSGDFSVIGRSVVIFDKGGSGNRFACANILPEKRAVNVITIKNPRYFSSALFMEQARDTLGIPPWMMFADAKKTRLVMEDTCVQLTVHFRGPDIQFLQEIFTELLAKGYITRYTRAQTNEKKSRFGYRLCRTEFNHARSSDMPFVLLINFIFFIFNYLFL